MSELEQAVLAYFIGGAAQEFTMAGRWFPRSDLVLIIEDKIQIATRPFGIKVKAKAKAAAESFVADMIAKGGWASKPNDFGGAMHQFQPDIYRQEIKALAGGDPILREACAAGEGFWADRFKDLTTA
ncbi:MAG: hypothetical protein KGK11_08520 [Sphingomonadales bacterium]|nr:hypothetical protein [Sphingomonadales bacterium]